MTRGPRSPDIGDRRLRESLTAPPHRAQAHLADLRQVPCARSAPGRRLTAAASRRRLASHEGYPCGPSIIAPGQHPAAHHAPCPGGSRQPPGQLLRPGAARPAAGMHAGTLTFTAAAPGTYQYLCPVPGHAQEGMTGTFTVR